MHTLETAPPLSPRIHPSPKKRGWVHHPFLTEFLFYASIACGLWSTTWLFKPKFSIYYTWELVLAATAIAALFTVFPKLLRVDRRPLSERPWEHTAYGSLWAAFVATATALLEKLFVDAPPSDAIIGLMLLAVAVLAMMEYLKPGTDYGVVQLFLRLPMKMAIDNYASVPPLRIFFSLAVLVLGSIWIPFRQRYKASPAAVSNSDQEGKIGFFARIWSTLFRQRYELTPNSQEGKIGLARANV